MKDEIKVEDMNTTPKKTEKKKTAKAVSAASKVKLQKLKDIEGKFLLVKVGTSEQPATEDHINDVRDKLVEATDEKQDNVLHKPARLYRIKV